MINQRRSPLVDREIEDYLANAKLDLTATTDGVHAYENADYVIISTPTNYDEKTVNSFVDGMFDRKIPLSVFHFDCFWMKDFNWCDFTWDSRVFPDPEAC